MIRVQVQLAGAPLRHTFVSYTPAFENPQIELTNQDGFVTFKGMKASSRIDVVVHVQNLAVRVLKGDTAGVTELSLRFRNRTNGAVCNITAADTTRFDHFKVMDRCYDVYQTVFLPVPPFNGASRRRFPFGGASREPHELKRSPQIDCRFPEEDVTGKLPWVQPQSLFTGVPLIHLKSQAVDARLFGTARRKATAIPHEFAHAIHFASMPGGTRARLALRYGVWIAKELLAGRSGTHRTEKSTAPLIAFVESIGIFSQRFFFFATEVEPGLRGAALRRAFVEDELSDSPALAKILPGYKRIATRGVDGVIRPRLTGEKVEGAVYGAIFLDFAGRTSLSTALNLFLRCHGFSFDDYAKFARKQRSGKYRSDLDAVAKTWKM